MLLPIVMMAGGGGVALLMFIPACLGVLGLIMHKPWQKPVPLWLIALAAFLSWAWIAQFWSSYPKVSGFSNAEKLWVMGLMFPAVIWLWAQMRDHPLGDILRKAVLSSLLIGLALLTFDTFSEFKLSYLIDPPASGEDEFWRRVDSVRNIGRGTIFTSVLLMPIAALIWYRPLGKTAIIIGAVIISIVAWKMDVSIAIAMPWIGLGVGAFAKRFPVVSLRLLFTAAILAILAAPVFASVLTLLDEKIFAAFPSSWEHRLYMWEFVFQQILEHPFIGHGFDSARTFTETVTLSEGYVMSLISLHTHNAGLQIWLETGLIGASLASLTIITLFRAAKRFALQSKIHAFGLCGFLAAMIIISSVSFGVWQFWWWGTLSFGLASLNLMQNETKLFSAEKA